MIETHRLKNVVVFFVCLQNPQFVIKTLIFNLFLVLLFFSMYFKISIVTLNILFTLILLKVIFLANDTCLKKHLILFISLNGSYLRSMLDTAIVFQSVRTILKISTSDVSFFTRFLCTFALFNIIILNFAKRTSFSNICTNFLILRQNLTLLLSKPSMVCLLFVFWILRLSITGFIIKIVFTLILGLIFITFIIDFILKLYIFINVYSKICNFFKECHVYTLRILSIFMLYYFAFFAIILLICIFVKLLHVFRNIVNLLYILSSRSVSVNFDKDITHTVRLECNITSLELWIIFPVTFLFLLIWCKQKCDKKIKIFLLFLMCLIFGILKYKNSSDFFNDVRTCTRSNFFLCVMIYNFRLLERTALFILFLNLNIGIWIHIFIY